MKIDYARFVIRGHWNISENWKKPWSPEYDNLKDGDTVEIEWSQDGIEGKMVKSFNIMKSFSFSYDHTVVKIFYIKESVKK